ncbi:MAG TPA: ferredoxin, partial [Mycobacterium sp.]|nr:ferredoxin [Mycobacterium sp.]
TDPAESRGALERLVAQRQPELVDLHGWHAINAAEIARGDGNRPRDKFTRVNAMLAVAAMAPRPTLRDKLRAALRV